ncbi:MAG: sulfatase [Verrucomicrobiales bacterium]|nr:sulfatase [Verrucomicrobiota bacterium JB025]
MKTIVLATLLLAIPCLAADPPNVLFIISGDLGARLACYGEAAAKTPNIDLLATQGTLFERCYTQRPTCGPSRMSMLSGLYIHESGLNGQKSRITESRIPAITLPHLFRKNGYTTARVGKVFHMGVPGDIGTAGTDDPQAWDLTVNNTGWDAKPENLAKVNRYGPRKDHSVAVTYLDPDIPDEEMVDGVGTHAALRLMKEQHPEKTGKPLMLFMGYFRTHPPMIAPRRHWDAIDPQEIRLPEVPENDRQDMPKGALPLAGPGHNFLPAGIGRDYAHAYYASIHFIDHEIGKLVAGLKTNGLADNTIIVITGDQGFHLGEHNYWHKTSAFDPSCHVPLIIIDPRAAAKGQRSAGLCGLIDLYPTLCDLAGIPPEHPLSGTSLAPRLHDAARPGKDWELTQLQNGVTLRTDRYRYTELKGGTMLYDLSADPHEWRNLAGKPSHAETERTLRNTLSSIIAPGKN